MLSVAYTQTQSQVLKLILSSPEERLSIRQIARKLKKSYTLTYHNIQKLIKAGILVAQAVPPAQIISISQNAPTSVLVDIEGQRAEDFLAKHSWIALYLKDVQRAAQPFFILIVFGSYAKGTQTAKSDIDILLITPTKESIKVMETAAQQYTKIKKNLVIVDAASHKEMIKNPNALNVGNEARKYHIILYGAEQYYQLLKQ